MTRAVVPEIRSDITGDRDFKMAGPSTASSLPRACHVSWDIRRFGAPSGSQTLTLSDTRPPHIRAVPGWVVRREASVDTGVSICTDGRALQVDVAHGYGTKWPVRPQSGRSGSPRGVGTSRTPHDGRRSGTRNSDCSRHLLDVSNSIFRTYPRRARRRRAAELFLEIWDRDGVLTSTCVGWRSIRTGCVELPDTGTVAQNEFTSIPHNFAGSLSLLMKDCTVAT